MAKKQNDDPEEAEPVPAEDEKRLEQPIAEPPSRRPKVTPLVGETTRVLLTGDHRAVITEAYVPTEGFGFRINVDGQWYEHVSDDAESGTWIFAPTR